jgi:DNA-3-methyladenine glycosylase II
MIESNGIIYLRRQKAADFFAVMARTVAGQQLSTKAAATIWSRVEKAAQDRKLKLAEFCCDAHVAIIKSCGVSGSKTKAIVLLNQAIQAKEIDPASLFKASHRDIVMAVTSLWGFGPWSADIIALFYFANPDVWSPPDVSLQRGLRALAGDKPARAEAILKVVRPYRSYLALHIWQALDSGRLP